jgi:hypothetical protein
VHGIGYVGDVDIRSAWLFDAVDPYGHDVDITMFPCPVCQRANQTNGFCAEHKMGFVNKRAYFSVVTHHLAKGTVRQAAQLSCPLCRKNTRAHGWCDTHQVGMIGMVALTDRQEYDEAVQAAEVLREASRIAARCDRCAVALITGTECPYIVYKDGKPFHRDPATVEGGPRSQVARP